MHLKIVFKKMYLKAYQQVSPLKYAKKIGVNLGGYIFMGTLTDVQNPGLSH